MDVTFLRHAQSVFNRDLTSDKDCELSELGLQQASQLKGQYDIIICSILKRAKQTLHSSNLDSKHLYFTDLCREVRRDICDFLDGEDETKLETEEELRKRIQEFKAYLKSKVPPGQSVLVICHRDFIYEFDKKGNEPQNCEFRKVTVE